MEDYIGKICPFCKTDIKEAEAVRVCPACGVPHHESCWNENKGCAVAGCSEQHCETQEAPKKTTCAKCGAQLQEDQEFCPKCGQRAGLAPAQDAPSAPAQSNAGVEKKKNKLLPIILGAVGVVVIAVVLFLVLKGPSVDEIILSQSSVEMKVDDSQSISYTINPEKAADVEVEWRSSNEKVASVSSRGKITAEGEGTCTITATAGGKSDSIRVTVKSGPDFESIYDTYCNASFATLGSDGSYLSIDTNPYDLDDYSVSGSVAAILSVNEALGLPDYLIDEMGSTTALMGRQSETFSDIGVTVSWSYHPDRGLEVTYKATN